VSEEIVVYQTEQQTVSNWTPVMRVAEIVARQNAVAALMKQAMKKDLHFGVIPGTGKKPTLLKAGAEMLTTFFGLSKSFTIVERTEDWTGEQHGGTQFFYYLIRCHLRRGDQLIAEADGSCNSMEKKYRYRSDWKNGQKTQVLNDDLASTVNTILKMASKRALVAATLLAVGASDFFTQDVEDMAADYAEAEYTVSEPEPEKKAEPVKQTVAESKQTIAPKINGKVLTPDKLRQAIGDKIAKYIEAGQDGEITTDVLRWVGGAMSRIESDDKKRISALVYLTGKSSTHDLSRAEGQALLDWLGIPKGGFEPLRAEATAEMQAVIAAHMTAGAVGTLPGFPGDQSDDRADPDGSGK
jgi:hypothetical protein